MYMVCIYIYIGSNDIGMCRGRCMKGSIGMYIKGLGHIGIYIYIYIYI